MVALRLYEPPEAGRGPDRCSWDRGQSVWLCLRMERAHGSQQNPWWWLAPKTLSLPLDWTSHVLCTVKNVFNLTTKKCLCVVWRIFLLSLDNCVLSGVESYFYPVLKTTSLTSPLRRSCPLAWTCSDSKPSQSSLHPHPSQNHVSRPPLPLIHVVLASSLSS